MSCINCKYLGMDEDGEYCKLECMDEETKNQWEIKHKTELEIEEFNQYLFLPE